MNAATQVTLNKHHRINPLAVATSMLGVALGQLAKDHKDQAKQTDKAPVLTIVTVQPKGLNSYSSLDPEDPIKILLTSLVPCVLLLGIN